MKHTFFVSAKIEGGTHFLVRNDAIDFENSTKLYKPSYLGSEFVKFGSQNAPFGVRFTFKPEQPLFFEATMPPVFCCLFVECVPRWCLRRTRKILNFLRFYRKIVFACQTRTHLPKVTYHKKWLRYCKGLYFVTL